MRFMTWCLLVKGLQQNCISNEKKYKDQHICAYIHKKIIMCMHTYIIENKNFQLKFSSKIIRKLQLCLRSIYPCNIKYLSMQHKVFIIMVESIYHWCFTVSCNYVWEVFIHVTSSIYLCNIKYLSLLLRSIYRCLWHTYILLKIAI